MKIKKSLKEGVCSAMRCQEAAESYDMAHRGFCARHYAELPEEEKVDGGFDGFGAMETPQTELVAKELEPVAADAEMSIEKLSELTILDCEMAEMFDGLLKDAHEQLKELETKRKKVTKHLVAAKKELDDLFKPAKTALSSMKDLLKAKLQEWYDEQEKARAAALAEGNQETVAITPEAETTTSTAVRKAWVLEVLNPDLVPKEFWTIDEAALRAYAESQGWVGVEIPGVSIYQRNKLVMGR